MNVLSLFDGISCARVALDRAGIKVNRYFASEIDGPAIEIALKNFPDTFHIGNVKDIQGSFYGEKPEYIFWNNKNEVLNSVYTGGGPAYGGRFTMSES